MRSGSFLVSGYLRDDKAESKQFIKRITDISAYAREAEPGTTKYAVCVPRDDPADTKTVWIIEE